VSSHDKLGNGVTYGGEILHADPFGACEGHGLGLMSIGVIIGKKIVLFKNALQSLQRRRYKMTSGPVPTGRMPWVGWWAVERERPWLRRCSTCLACKNYHSLRRHTP